MTMLEPLGTLPNALFFSTAEILAYSVTDMLERKIQAAVNIRGVCRLVFPGGHSIVRVLELLRERSLPWSAVHFYLSDERCVPVGHIQRNDRLIKEAFFRKVPLPSENLHSIPAELGAEEGAESFSELLLHTPPFDIALLSAGPDGHTASLFPGDSALHDTRYAVPILNAPKPPQARVSIGLTRLRLATERWMVIAGAEKRDLVVRLMQGEILPVTQIQPTKWFVDQSLVPLHLAE